MGVGREATRNLPPRNKTKKQQQQNTKGYQFNRDHYIQPLLVSFLLTVSARMQEREKHQQTDRQRQTESQTDIAERQGVKRERERERQR